MDDYPELRDAGRLAEVVRLGLDQEQARPHLDEVVQAVADRLATPFALVTVLLNDAQVFAAGTGPVPAWIAESGGTPIEWAFCCPLLRDPGPRAYEDFVVDPAFEQNPLVTVEGIRSYLGAPLISNGKVIGGLCGVDVRPRHFVPEEVTFLREMAAETVRRLQAHAAPEDPLPDGSRSP